ncbi:MAG: hypothetical protein NTX82_04030 [Candidatus Parcubacteria bacterium]|nr:hypothetical protein [Candidatus Parcubacteria bacterium]
MTKLSTIMGTTVSCPLVLGTYSSPVPPIISAVTGATMVKNATIAKTIILFISSLLCFS